MTSFNLNYSHMGVRASIYEFGERGNLAHSMEEPLTLSRELWRFYY